MTTRDVWRWAALAALLPAVAGAEAPAPAMQKPSQPLVEERVPGDLTQKPVCNAIQVTSTPAMNVRRNRFPSGTVLDLNFALVIPGRISGDELIDVKFYTPNNHLYESRPVVLYSGSLRPADAARSDGARSVQVQSGKDANRGIVTAQVPPLLVGGTDITRNSLHGTWRVEAVRRSTGTVDCSTTFTLLP